MWYPAVSMNIYPPGKPIVTMLPPEQTEFFPDAIYAAFDPNGFLPAVPACFR